jgi:ATP-dependent helicase/nuclease subunit A
MPNELLIYKSSAGSGKTYTLVMEYLKLVLQQPKLYKSILAITFTNKATEEMKSRIISALHKLSNSTDIKFLQSVMSHTGLKADEVTQRSERVLNNILHDYSGFAVSTIDSFFSRIVRALARELHLPVRFDTELDMDYVSDEITFSLLSKVEEDKNLRNWLESFMISKLNDDRGWRLDEEIKKVTFHLFDEHFRKIFPNGYGPPDMVLITELQSIKNDFENRMAGYSKKFESILKENNLTMDDFHYKKSGVAGYLLKLGRKKLVVDDFKPGKRALDAFESPEKWVSASSPLRELIIRLAEEHFIEIGTGITQNIEQHFMRYVSAVCVLDSAYMAGIIGTLDQELKLFRDQKNLVLISDHNLLLKKHIGNQDAPFIYEKSGNRYSHFMLDEFQDTSDFQWRNIFPLVNNALGSGHYTLLVGDAKQSIYRWRGGNMLLLQSHVQENLGHFEGITRVQNLDTNYRSRQVIVDFNNEFFNLAIHELNSPGLVESINHPYGDKSHEQKWVKGEAGQGYVQFCLLKTEKSAVDTETGEETEETNWKETACTHTFDTIKRLLEQGYRYRDLAILTRSNADALEITGYLMSKGIMNILSPESMLLMFHPQVRFLINVLTWIDDKNNRVALAQIVQFLKTSFPENSSGSLHQYFAGAGQLNTGLLPDVFTKRRISWERMPLTDLAEEIIRLFELNTEPNAYIQRFTDVLIEYTRKYQGNISDFLQWWEENREKDKCTVILPSGLDAIRVMTIHKSKGLQFPVVLMPFAEWKMASDYKSEIWVSNDSHPFNLVNAHPVRIKSILEESLFAEEYYKEIGLSLIDNLNLLYVAFTRAEEQLIVCAKFPPEKTGEGSMIGTGRLIANCLSAIDNLKMETDQRGNMFFESGAAHHRLEKSASQADDSTPITEWISEPWRERLHMIVNKNRISKSDPITSETDYGIHFHRCISQITGSSGVEKLLDSYIKTALLEHEVQLRLKKDVQTVVRLSDESGWYDDSFQSLSETEILSPDGSVIRPDRVLMRDNRVVVIDYKTGKESESHQEQLRNYAEVLYEMGYGMVEMYLVYTSNTKVTEVNAA